MIEVSAVLGSIRMEHVDDCCCRYVASPKDTTDVKLIDTRCIAAYLIPVGECGQSDCQHAPDGGNHPEVGRG